MTYPVSRTLILNAGRFVTSATTKSLHMVLGLPRLLISGCIVALIINQGISMFQDEGRRYDINFLARLMGVSEFRQAFTEPIAEGEYNRFQRGIMTEHTAKPLMLAHYPQVNVITGHQSFVPLLPETIASFRQANQELASLGHYSNPSADYRFLRNHYVAAKHAISVFVADRLLREAKAIDDREAAKGTNERNRKLLVMAVEQQNVAMEKLRIFYNDRMASDEQKALAKRVKCLRVYQKEWQKALALWSLDTTTALSMLGNRELVLAERSYDWTTEQIVSPSDEQVMRHYALVQAEICYHYKDMDYMYSRACLHQPEYLV